MDHANQVVVAITGASGAIYARALCRLLAQAGACVHVIVSPHGRELLATELGVKELSPAALLGTAAPTNDVGLAVAPDTVAAGLIRLHDYHDLADPLSSGSVLTGGMAICPCSSNTLAAVAAGLADNLITRAAHVHLKQRRPLVIVPREMPVSAIELENQLRLAHAGAIIAPACPGFYQHPQTIDDLAEFVAARIADALGIHTNAPRYRDLT